MADVAITMALSGFDGVKTGFAGVEREAAKMGTGIDGLSKKFEGFGKQLTSMKGMLTGLGVGAAVGWLAKLEDGMEKSARAASRLGVSFESFQKLELTAKRFGASAGSAEQALKFFNRQIGEASMQPMGMSSKLFEALGVEITDTGGKIKNTEQLFRESIDAIKGVGSGAEQTKAIMTLFGEQSGDLVDIFKGGTPLVDEFGNKFEKLGMIVSDKVAPTFRDANSIVYDTMDMISGHAMMAIAGAITAIEDLGTAASDAWAKVTDDPRGKVLTSAGSSLLSDAPDAAANAALISDMNNRSLAGAFDADRVAAEAERKRKQQLQAWQRALDERERAEEEKIQRREESEARAAELDERRWQRKAELYAAVQSPLERYAQGLDEVNTLFEEGERTGERYIRIVDGLDRELAQSNRTFTAVENALSQMFDAALTDGREFGQTMANIGKQLAMDIGKANVFDPMVSSIEKATGRLMGGEGENPMADAMEKVFDNFLDKLGKGLSMAWDGLASIFNWLIGEQNALAIFETGERWAVAIWEAAERWAQIAWESASNFFGFETGGEMTVTRPTLVMVGEKNKAERIRVSPVGGPASRHGLGDGGSSSGGTVQVIIPPTALITNITAGQVGRTMARYVRNENGRRV